MHRKCLCRIIEYMIFINFYVKYISDSCDYRINFFLLELHLKVSGVLSLGGLGEIFSSCNFDYLMYFA